jgi:hypothetical protein
MKFRLWLERNTIDKPLRRKMERLVRVYLGYSPQTSSFQVSTRADWDKEFPPNDLFGQPSGFRTPGGGIQVPEDEAMSALHEVLHNAGFLPNTISDFWNEGITQVISEDIAEKNGLQIPKSYKTDTAYVRKALLPVIDMDLQTLARQYGKADDKAMLLAKLVWKSQSHRFENEEDWGANPFEGLYETFQRGLGPGSMYLDYLITEPV